ncbi:MAG: M18 family aminopeptidase [Bacteriovoracaceae bacterium]
MANNTSAKAKKLNSELIDFLKNSPTPFHAVKNMEAILKKNGFKEIKESQKWELKKDGRYYLKKNDSSLLAFQRGKKDLLKTGIRMVGAHTDSPCLRVKPSPNKHFKNYFQLSVDIYGGALLNPWFDRDLSMAGRVNYINKKGDIVSELIDLKRPIAFIPSLAIHLDRKANENRTIAKQKDLNPIILQNNDKMDFHKILTKSLKGQVKKILEHEVYLYDCQEPNIVGLEEDFLASARLDNLLSCFIGLKSLLNSKGDVPSLLICNDHEEVGSASACGAEGPMLKSFLERLLGSAENLARTIDLSMMVSADNAHGIHPNYSDKHDENHGPILNAGPVIKINNNQRYATNSDTSSMFSFLCEKAKIPYQKFVVRNDMGCGSTIGPITATSIGVKTIDVGVPTFGMHSLRELAGTQDSHHLMKVLEEFYNSNKVMP